MLLKFQAAGDGAAAARGVTVRAAERGGGGGGSGRPVLNVTSPTLTLTLLLSPETLALMFTVVLADSFRS